jgi:phosphomannomutase
VGIAGIAGRRPPWVDGALGDQFLGTGPEPLWHEAHPLGPTRHGCRRGANCLEWVGRVVGRCLRAHGPHCTAVPPVDPSDPGDLAPLLAAAARWRSLDPDEGTRAELDALVAGAEAGEPEPLAAAFAGRVALGTAGLRAPMGPGPSRMNRLVVRRATAALVTLLPADATVVIGHDARRHSDRFAADAARVVAASGRQVVLLPGPLPTPVVAFAVRHLGADAGVTVTASHNPAADNGYKVYLADGAQIGPPVEGDLGAALDLVADRHDAGEPDAVPFSADPVVPDGATGAEVVDAYVAMVAGRLGDGPREVTLAYTAMHGVGRAVTVRAFAAAGFAPLAEVDAQCEPDGTFPTVAFPNPEEPGALDLLVERAAAAGADVGLAHDPDADRLGVVVPRSGAWERLTGDQIGVLLADHLLRQGSGAERLVVRTIVSSRLLDVVAAAHGVTSAATLTGFKHVMGAARARPDLRLVLGYEEALGFAVGDQVRDKDGIGAALVMADLVARLRSEGRTLDDRLDELAERHGLHVSASRSYRFDGLDGNDRRAAATAALRAHPPAELGGRSVLRVVDHLAAGTPEPVADVVVLELGAGSWVAVRPSGTEPKLKVYAEVVEGVSGDGVVAARARAEASLDRLHVALATRLGFPSGGPGLR